MRQFVLALFSFSSILASVFLLAGSYAHANNIELEIPIADSSQTVKLVPGSLRKRSLDGGVAWESQIEAFDRSRALIARSAFVVGGCEPTALGEFGRMYALSTGHVQSWSLDGQSVGDKLAQAICIIAAELQDNGKPVNAKRGSPRKHMPKAHQKASALPSPYSESPLDGNALLSFDADDLLKRPFGTGQLWRECAQRITTMRSYYKSAVDSSDIVEIVVLLKERTKLGFLFSLLSKHKGAHSENILYECNVSPAGELLGLTRRQ